MKLLFKNAKQPISDIHLLSLTFCALHPEWSFSVLQGNPLSSSSIMTKPLFVCLTFEETLPFWLKIFILHTVFCKWVGYFTSSMICSTIWACHCQKLSLFCKPRKRCLQQYTNKYKTWRVVLHLSSYWLYITWGQALLWVEEKLF